MSEIEKAINCLSTFIKTLEHYEAQEKETKAMKIAIQALQEKLERENPQPMTLDELISSRGKPLYLKDITDLPFGYGNKWFICDLDNLPSAFYEYGKTWIAYRYKPTVEQVEKHIGEATNMVEGE